MAKGFWPTLLALALAGGAQAQGTGRSKPLVLLFGVQRDRPVAVAEKRDDPDGLDETQRMSIAVRAVRQALLEESVVEPMVFMPDMPTIARAMLDARVTLADGKEPTEAERVRIAAACGASYIVLVSRTYSSVDALIKFDARQPKPQEPGKKPPRAVGLDAEITTEKQTLPVLELEALEVKPGRTPAPGRRWKDVARVTDGMSPTQVARRGGISDALNSAARTLVLRFLGGPLRELRRLTPSATLLPQAATPPIALESAADNGADPAAQATQARQRGETLLREGNPEEGIRTLRRAVSLAPRALATRLSLVKAYLSVNRPDRAEDEARRALLVGDPGDAASRAELVRLLGTTLLSAGDPDGARENFEKALTGDPNNLEVRLALAKLQLEKGDIAAAEGQFQAVLKGRPDDREAALGMARILCLRGDFDGAQKALAAAPSIDARQRHDFVTGVFLESAMRIAARIAQNRTALEEGALDKATFKTALVAQLKRMGSLEKMLKASPPPASAAEVVARAHKHRLLAASLLIQALTTMQTFLDTGENASGAQSRVFLGEFFAEIKEAANPGEG